MFPRLPLTIGAGFNRKTYNAASGTRSSNSAIRSLSAAPAPAASGVNAFPGDASDTQSHVGMKFYLGVRAVAKGLVGRLTAAAHGHPIARFVCKAVSRHQCDFAAQPNWSAAIFFRILYETDGRRQLMLHGSFRRPVPGDETARGTITNLAKKRCPYASIVCAGDFDPDTSVRVRKIGQTRKGFPGPSTVA